MLLCLRERSRFVFRMLACSLENALTAALNQAQLSGKVFSTQNWLKTKASIEGETLVAGTVAGMLLGFPHGKALLDLMKVPASACILRWSAE